MRSVVIAFVQIMTISTATITFAQAQQTENKAVELRSKISRQDEPGWRSTIERQFSVEQSEQINVLVEFSPEAKGDGNRIERERQTGNLTREGALDGWRVANTEASKSLSQQLESIGVKVVQSYEYLPHLLVRIDRNDLNRLTELEGIVSVSPDLESRSESRKTIDPEFNKSTKTSLAFGTDSDRERTQLSVSTDAVKARDAWARGFDGSEQVTAVLDDGIFRTHEMFQGGGIVTEACFSGGSTGQSLCPNAVTQIKGQTGAASLCSGGNQVCEHGTHVAGIVMGYTAPWVDRSRNSANTRLGVAPQSYALPIQVFSRVTSGCSSGSSCLKTFSSDQLGALNYLIDVVNQKLLPSPKQLVAVNMSLGGDPIYEDYCFSDPRASAIKLLRQLGVLTVISSGNDSATGRVSAPACIKEAISVDASTRAHTDSVAYSNSAFTNDILAPGGTASNPITSAGTSTTTSYVGLFGTSMAAPHVAGAIAILRTKMLNATADQVEWAIKKSASRYIVYGISDRTWPTGLLDVNAAIDVIGQRPVLGVPVAGYYPSSFAGGFNYLRIYNPGSTAGTVNLTLVRDDTGEVLGSYLQQVPARSAIQVQMATLQTNIGGNAPTVPNTTTLTVYYDASFLGYAQNILWNASAQSLTNITSCADPQPDPNRMLGNVHTALIDGSYPSVIRIHNRSSSSARAIFDVHNSSTGTLIGTWTTPDSIAPQTTKTYSAMAAYNAIGFTPDVNTFHTAFILKSDPNFVLGHVVNNVGANLMTDMTPKCRI